MRRPIPLSALLAMLVGCAGADPEPPPEPDPVGVFGTAPPAVLGTVSVVTLDATRPLEVENPTDDPTIDQLGLEFSPKHLLVRVGQAVGFTNSETIGHNVHLSAADTDSTVLNTDTDPGRRVEFVFDTGGAYVVTCDVHPGMRALVFVTDATYGVFAEESGDFIIPDVPAGAYTLSIWSAEPELRSRRPIEVVGASTAVNLGTSG